MPSNVKTNRVQELLGDGTGGDISPPPLISETQTVVTLLTEDIGYHRQQTRELHEGVEQLHQKSHYVEWSVRTSERARSSPQALLEELADLGFAWRDIARLVGVSVAAVQKWRRGGRTTGENRQKIASLLAACDLVATHYGVQEAASWFEIPLVRSVPLTPIDLWAAGRVDLVFDYASGHSDSEQTVTAWDPQWRETYDSSFEVYRAGDGQLSVRPKDW
ncbi:MAG: hypothetical protein M3R63_12265 [Actinomycetota bacterium]|nr:hypothetical protein [Actinomycetota bacterium]